MNRKTIIRCVVALGVLGALVIAFWSGEGEGAVSITYAGVSANDSNRVIFHITNRSNTIFIWDERVSEYRSNDWHSLGYVVPYSEGKIRGHSVTNFERTAPSTNRWAIWVSYNVSIPDYPILHWREKIWRYGLYHSWPRAVQWICPWKRWNYAGSPEMLGNKPAPPEQK